MTTTQELIAQLMDKHDMAVTPRTRELFLKSAKALEALQAEVADMQDTIDSNNKLCISRIAELTRERNAALARLAAIEKQKPVAWGMLSKQNRRIYDVIDPEEHDGYEGAYTVPLFAAAGASPQPGQPASAFKKLSDSEVIWLAQSHGIEGNPLSFYADLISTQPVQPSQARELSTEQMRCIEEGYSVCNEDTYFDARKGRDSTEARNIFTAAHRMGWLAAINTKETK